MVPFFWSGLLSFLVTFIKCKSLRIEKKRGSMWLVSVVNFKSFKVGLYESPTRCMFKSWVCRPIQIAYYILHVGREIKFCLCQCLVGNSVRSFVRSVGRSVAGCLCCCENAFYSDSWGMKKKSLDRFSSRKKLKKRSENATALLPSWSIPHDACMGAFNYYIQLSQNLLYNRDSWWTYVRTNVDRRKATSCWLWPQTWSFVRSIRRLLIIDQRQASW